MNADIKKIENDVKNKMKKLGIYKPEYGQIISIYAGMLHEYNEFETMFRESGYQITEEYTNKAGATNERKVPLYSAMECIRKDILAYSDRLCLNPKSLKTVTIDSAKKSNLSKVLSSFGK